MTDAEKLAFITGRANGKTATANKAFSCDEEEWYHCTCSEECKSKRVICKGECGCHGCSNSYCDAIEYD